MTPTIRTLATFLAALLVLCFGQVLFALGRLPSGTTMIAGVGLHILGVWLAFKAYQHLGTSQTLEQEQPPLTRSVQLICLALVIVIAAVLRLAWLDRLPLRIDGDAAGFALAAADFVGSEPPPLIGTGWQSHTNVLFFLQSLTLRVVGRTVHGVRVLGALGGILSVITIFMLGRRLWSWRVGVFAALATAVMPFHLVFSRVGTEVVHMTWLLPLVMLCVLHGWERHSVHWLLSSGAIVGFSQYFYPGARLIPILLVVQIGLLAVLPPDAALNRSPTRLQARKLLVALGWTILGFMAVYGPMIRYFIQYPDEYIARINIVSITASGWLAEQLQQQPLWQILSEQIRRAYLPFVYPIGGARMWYLWPQYLGGVDAALFLIGLVGVLVAQRTPYWLRIYLLVYLLGGMFLGGVLTIDTPMPSRYVIFVPATALLIGWALDQTAQIVMHMSRGRWQDIATGVVVGGVCAYAVANVASYVRHDTDETWDADPTGQMATYTGQFLRTLPDQQYDIYFLQTEMMYYQANPLLTFLTDKSGTNLVDPVTCNDLTEQFRARQNVVIAPPGRIDELQQISRELRVSEFTVFRNPRGEEVAAVLRTLGAVTCASVATSRMTR